MCVCRFLQKFFWNVVNFYDDYTIIFISDVQRRISFHFMKGAYGKFT